jgi:hypothetical protein
VHTWGPSYAAKFIQQGFKMIMLTSDTAALTEGARAHLSELKRLQDVSNA